MDDVLSPDHRERSEHSPYHREHREQSPRPQGAPTPTWFKTCV